MLAELVKLIVKEQSQKLEFVGMNEKYANMIPEEALNLEPSKFLNQCDQLRHVSNNPENANNL